jgi:hypothetical protein
MKYTVEIGSGAVIDLPGFLKTGSGIHKLTKGYRHTDYNHKPNFVFFFKIRKLG